MKAMIGIVLVAASLLMTAKPAHATITAGDLQGYCKDTAANREAGKPTVADGMCLGFVTGVLQFLDETPIFRVEGQFYGLQLVKDISNGDAIILFVDYMKTHPEDARKYATTGVVSALMDAKVLAIVPVAENSTTQ
jgi:hypothetical protein